MHRLAPTTKNDAAPEVIAARQWREPDTHALLPQSRVRTVRPTCASAQLQPVDLRFEFFTFVLSFLNTALQYDLS